MNFVITGASGFIGRRLIEVLSQNSSNKINTLSRSPGSCVYNNIPEGDMLIHLGENSNLSDVAKLGEAHIKHTTETLLELTRRKFERIFYASSGVVYGDQSSVLHKENEAIGPQEIYGRAKKECENILLENSHAIIGRLGNVYGIGMKKNSVITDIVTGIRAHNEIQIQDGRPVRDFIWLDDLVKAIIEMSTSKHSGVFNIASGGSLSVIEIATMAKDLASNKNMPIIETAPSSLKKDSKIFFDMTKTFSHFSWRPETSMMKGLTQLLESK